MNKLFITLVSLFLIEIAFANPPNLIPYTQAQEKDVKSFISVGMDAKKVIEKFGPPNISDMGAEGEEVWQYIVDPKTMRQRHSNYAGFEVFLKSKKVTYVGIIYASVVQP